MRCSVSSDTYVKGHDRYDYDGEEYLGYTYEGGLDVWNENAYVINDRYHLYNTDEDDPFNQETHYYDIRFTAYHKEREMKILLNVEAQRSSDSGKLGYHLENRIIFYLARMISAQKQTEFFHSDFDSLKRVRSIWICMDNEETEDSIEEISFDRKTVFGNKKDPYHTDLIKGIIVNIRNRKARGSGKVIEKSKNVLIAMLEELLFGKDASETPSIKAHTWFAGHTRKTSRNLRRRP